MKSLKIQLNGSSVYLRSKYDNIIVLILIKKMGIFTFKIEFKITGQLLNTAGIYKPYIRKVKIYFEAFFGIPHVCMHARNIFFSLTHTRHWSAMQESVLKWSKLLGYLRAHNPIPNCGDGFLMTSSGNYIYMHTIFASI